MHLLPCIFCVLLLFAEKTWEGELPRGVPLSKSSFYQFGQLFTCLDGSSAVSWLKVNDDYCDCRDGSDEPGTSACPNGRFFCRDMQYRPVYLPSAYVNDTICDCCDGSDEYGDSANCPSACGALAAALREAQSIKRNQIEQGHKIFKEYVENLKERKAKGLFHEEEELKSSEHNISTNSVNSDEETIQASVNVDSQSPSNDEHLTSSPSSSVDQNQHSPDDHNKLVEHKESLSNTEHHEDKLDEHDHDDNYDELDNYKQSNDESHHENPPPHEESVVQHRPTLIPIDYGPEEGFRMLTELPDGCLDLNDREYTYSLCPFKSVHQKSLGSSKSNPGTSIGVWSRWLESDENEKSYKVMLYENGLQCWNGPARSTKVFVHCGDSNQLTAVSEPSRCEYVMQLITPAACYENPDESFRKIHPEL